MKLGWSILTKTQELWVHILWAKQLSSGSSIRHLENPKHGSHIWNAIKKIQNKLSQGVKSTVVNRQGTKFWQDTWLLDKPLIEATYGRIEEDDINRVVLDYTNGNCEWNWQELSALFNDDVISIFAGYKAPKAKTVDDQLYWSKVCSSEFLVKSAYNFICMDRWEERCDKWQLPWKIQVPQCIRAFLCMVMHKVLLTNQHRSQRHITDDPNCEIFLGIAKDGCHVLRDCCEATWMWNHVVLGEFENTFIEANLDVWFTNNLWDTSKNGDDTTQNVVFNVGCWHNWKWRNDRVFSNKVTQRKAHQVSVLA